MFGQLIRRGFAVLVASLLLTAAASADEWRIVQSSGGIWIGSEGVQKASLAPNEVVPGGATLTTGSGGRAMLTHGTQTMMVGPNAVVTVPDSDGAGITTILQRAGEITFDVDRQKVQHFAVETPYLAAVVKGTRFTVSIENDGATVSVDRGLVEVTNLATGERVDTPAGQRATVGGSGGNLHVAGSGQLALLTQGDARSPLVTRVSGEELLALQSTTPDNASTSGLAPVRGGSLDSTSSLSLVAGAASDNDGGNSGGSTGGSGPTGVAGGQAGGTGDSNADNAIAGAADAAINATIGVAAGLNEEVLAAQEAVALNAINQRTTQRFERGDEKTMTAFAIAVVFALSVLLAIGFAYVRRIAG